MALLSVTACSWHIAHPEQPFCSSSLPFATNDLAPHSEGADPQSGRTRILIAELPKGKDGGAWLRENTFVFLRTATSRRKAAWFCDLGAWQTRWTGCDLPRILVMVCRWVHWCIKHSDTTIKTAAGHYGCILVASGVWMACTRSSRKATNAMKSKVSFALAITSVRSVHRMSSLEKTAHEHVTKDNIICHMHEGTTLDLQAQHCLSPCANLPNITFF